ncbi:MAG: aminotransferase class III-fold pyridoxal phosphate-dependent enzyme, partial [Pseudomonadota bacterium]
LLAGIGLGFVYSAPMLPIVLQVLLGAGIIEGLTHEQNENRICERFEARIQHVGPESCLALFMEPVGGLATGANVLSGRFLKRMREICTKYGLLLILDEVMSGAGRSGKFLTTHHHGDDCKPDLVVLAKGIGSGYIPLGIMLAPAAMVDELSGLSGFNYGHTSNANPLACAVGLATLEEMEERKLIENAASTGAYLMQRMNDLAQTCPIIGDVRGLGLLQATELVADRATKKTFSAEVKAPDTLRRMGLDHGLSLYARRTNNGKYGDWVMTSPPLITTQVQVDEMVDLLGQLYSAFTDKLVRDGVRVA